MMEQEQEVEQDHRPQNYRYVIVECRRCGYSIAVPYEFVLRNPSFVYRCKGRMEEARCNVRIAAPELVKRMQNENVVKVW